MLLRVSGFAQGCVGSFVDRRYLSIWCFRTGLNANPNAELVIFKTLGCTCCWDLRKTCNRLVGSNSQGFDLTAFNGAVHRTNQWYGREINHATHQIFQVWCQAAVGGV